MYKTSLYTIYMYPWVAIGQQDSILAKCTEVTPVYTFTSDAIPSVSRLAMAQETSNSVSAVGISITREYCIGTLIKIWKLTLVSAVTLVSHITGNITCGEYL